MAPKGNSSEQDSDRINLDEFPSGGGPKLEADDLTGDTAVLTITEFEKFTVKDPETESGERPTAVLRFNETGPRSLWLNKGMLTTLVEKLGDRPKEWVGKLCPVEKRSVTFRGKTTRKVYVMAAEEWEDTIKEYKKRESKTRR
jgi:hypothetical protein